jgi:hypothetical protein
MVGNINSNDCLGHCTCYRYCLFHKVSVKEEVRELESKTEVSDYG